MQDLLLQMNNIERKISLPHGSSHQHETDSEHSFNLALTAWYLAQYLPELDKSKVLQYALAHDLVETIAGDVMAIGRTSDEQANKDKREEAAIEQLSFEWPDFPDMTESLRAYQYQTDPEAVFVRALDKIVSILVNIQADGRIWHELEMDRQEVIAYKDEATKRHAFIAEIWQVLRKHLLDHDELFPTLKK